MMFPPSCADAEVGEYWQEFHFIFLGDVLSPPPARCGDGGHNINCSTITDDGFALLLVHFYDTQTDSSQIILTATRKTPSARGKRHQREEPPRSIRDVHKEPHDRLMAGNINTTTWHTTSNTISRDTPPTHTQQ